METERRNKGSLLVFDTLKPGSKLRLPKSIKTEAGIIKVYRVDINPIRPSDLS